jgi:hypothetical protein
MTEAKETTGDYHAMDNIFRIEKDPVLNRTYLGFLSPAHLPL